MHDERLEEKLTNGISVELSALLNCPCCKGAVAWCDCGVTGGKGCHRIVCSCCGLEFDSEKANGDTLEELRGAMAGIFNFRGNVPAV